MQRLISAVTALSMALYVVPPFAPTAARAQDATLPQPMTADGQPIAVPEGAFVVGLDGAAVICLPNKQMDCPEGALCVVAKAEAQCLKRAAAQMAALAAKSATDDTAPAAGDDTATAEPATDSATDTTAEATTAEAPATDATADAAPAVPEVQPMTADGQPIALPDGAFLADLAGEAVICLPNKQVACPEGAFCVVAKAEAACLKRAAAQKAQTAATDDQTAATDSTEPAPDATTADATTADATEADTAPAPDAPAADAPAAPAPADAGGLARADGALVFTVDGQEVICLPAQKSVKCEDGAICVRPKTQANCAVAVERKLAALKAAAAEDKALIETQKAAAAAAAAAALAAGQPLVDAPQPEAEAVASLDQALAAPTPDQTAPDDQTAGAETAATAAVVALAEAALNPDAPPAADAKVTEETVTKDETRTSDEEFAAAPAVTADGKKKTGLSTLEKVGLVALGALVVGQVLKGKNEVVSNSGDRVVVKDPQGNYQVYKDDDTLLRQPGADVRTETFKDGSTRTTVLRADGSRVVTIRDATGRVLRRSAFDARGLETRLIDDTEPEDVVDVSTLPPPPVPHVSADSDPDLAAALAAVEAEKAGRKFSLRQIRLIPEVKALAAPLPVVNVTFESGSAAIRPDQAEALAALGDTVNRLIRKNPNRIFLIEGHTDAVGGAPMNLTLSDRRAESVAKALTEYFGVPPENLVVQGYGESQLAVDTQASERANRRVVVRDVTALLRQVRG